MPSRAWVTNPSSEFAALTDAIDLTKNTKNTEMIVNEMQC
jgi:hypothetical protein